ncbi:hypothetical protein LJR289_004320 [Pseudoduganella sp. LjRoot289]|uniref:hypothetical protein n=1 Tax=Pseudoduganella sp. LjRoot289 TaxID=3342314 RepID=UPI003ECFEF46
MFPIAPAPIACTLSAANFKERAIWLRELTARALLSHRVEGLQMYLSYRPDARDDVEKMVQQERQCCDFLKYELRPGTGSIEVVVTGPAEASVDAQALFAHLIPQAGTAAA